MRFLKIGLFLIAILYISVFLYYKYGWQNYYPKERIDMHIAEIRTSPTFPDRFYQLYDKSRGDRRERISNRYWKNFWSEFLSIDKPLNDNWEFVAANMVPYKGHRYKLAPMTLAFEIDNSTTPENVSITS